MGRKVKKPIDLEKNKTDLPINLKIKITQKTMGNFIFT